MKNQQLLQNFEKIYIETYDNTLKYIIYKCNNLNDVDDIIQETYLEFYRMLKNNNEILNNQAYILTIAKNKIIKYSKKNKEINIISIFQENDNQEFVMDIDARYKYRIYIYNQK